MAFSFAVHGLLIFGILRTMPLLLEHAPNYKVLDITLSQASAQLSPEQAYLKSEQAQLGVLSLEPERESGSFAEEGAAVLSSNNQSNAQYTVPIGFRDNELWLKYNNSSVKKRTVSAASHEAKDAAYLAQWREKIERVGTQQYQQSISNKLAGGDLLMLVAIDRAGNLLEIQIRRSSGNPELDALAVAIVHDAAPFATLPEAMQQDTEVLEIIRTWRFRAGS